MPAQRLGSHLGARYDVVGSCAGSTTAVTHVGLLAKAGVLTLDLEIEIFDMAPPLRLAPPGTMKAHLSGTAGLSKVATAGIEEWLAEMRTMIYSCAYFAMPSAERARDEVTGRAKGWRFSCAGFVAAAYLEGAQIRLVVDDSALPPLGFETVRQVWEHIVSRFPEPMQRALLAKFGLTGNGPWSVLVPGYLFHALDCAVHTLPYSPVADNITFP